MALELPSKQRKIGNNVHVLPPGENLLSLYESTDGQPFNPKLLDGLYGHLISEGYECGILGNWQIGDYRFKLNIPDTGLLLEFWLDYAKLQVILHPRDSYKVIFDEKIGSKIRTILEKVETFLENYKLENQN